MQWINQPMRKQDTKQYVYTIKRTCIPTDAESDEPPSALSLARRPPLLALAALPSLVVDAACCCDCCCWGARRPTRRRAPVADPG